MSRSAYEIRAVGDVPSELLDDFEGATVSIDPGGFTIHVVLGDDAELHGLLAALDVARASRSSTCAASRTSSRDWQRAPGRAVPGRSRDGPGCRRRPAEGRMVKIGSRAARGRRAAGGEADR